MRGAFADSNIDARWRGQHFSVVSLHLPLRPRRLRRTAALRRLVRETRVSADDLIYPLFVHEGAGNVEISSMPGVVRHSLDSLVKECEAACSAGIPAVAIFPALAASLKD
jgi:porphobilinogen synthase